MPEFRKCHRRRYHVLMAISWCFDNKAAVPEHVQNIRVSRSNPCLFLQTQKRPLSWPILSLARVKTLGMPSGRGRPWSQRSPCASSRGQATPAHGARVSGQSLVLLSLGKRKPASTLFFAPSLSSFPPSGFTDLARNLIKLWMNDGSKLLSFLCMPLYPHRTLSAIHRVSPDEIELLCHILIRK